MNNCDEVDQPYEGQQFKSFDALKKYLEEYGQKNYVKFWIRSSHTKNSLKSKQSKIMNPDLKYVCIKFACIFGGEKIRCRGSGMRKCSTYRNLGCPCKINAVVGEDGNHLKLNTVILEHNHVLCKTLYDSLKKTKKKNWNLESSKQLLGKITLPNSESIERSSDNDIVLSGSQSYINKKDTIISICSSGKFNQNLEEEKKSETAHDSDSTRNYLQSIKEKYGRNVKILVVNSQNAEETYFDDILQNGEKVDTQDDVEDEPQNLETIDSTPNLCSDICRLCLSSKEKLLPIFNPDLPVKSTILSFKIMGCASIEISCDDGLPNNICTTCEANLDIAYNFRIRCENSDSILRKAYLTKEMFQTKESFGLRNNEEENVDENAVFQEDSTLINYQLLANDENNVKDSNEISKEDLQSNQFSVNCPLCNLETESYEKMLEHLDNHLNEEILLPCNICNDICPTVKELQDHIRLHVSEFDSTYFSPDDKILPIQEFQIQEETHPVSNAEAPKKHSEMNYLCNVCGKILKTKDRFRSHKNTHEGLRPHVCLKCGRGFADRRNMHHHYNVMHLRKPKLECPVCKKKFYTRTKMKSHITMHYGVKPFSCDVCDKTFRLKMNMIKHKKTHSNDRPHKCDKCSAAFIDKNMLKRHSYIHGGIRPHPCPVCGHRFSVKFHLKKHLEKSKCRVGAVVMSEDFQWMNIEQSENNAMEKECVMVYKSNDENPLGEGMEAITMDILQEYQEPNS